MKRAVRGRVREGTRRQRLLACSHAGVVNACLSASKAFGGMPVDVVIGGYHLAGKAMEERIEPTIRDLEARVVAPGHCTGWRAKARLAQAFSPGRYGPSVVGTTYRLADRTGPHAGWNHSSGKPTETSLH